MNSKFEVKINRKGKSSIIHKLPHNFLYLFLWDQFLTTLIFLTWSKNNGNLNIGTLAKQLQELLHLRVGLWGQFTILKVFKSVTFKGN